MAFNFGGNAMNKLREKRVLRRVSQFQLRIATGIHQSKISLIENGLVEPKPDERKRLSRALGVRPEEIFSAEQR
jgi:transcriptional regulator with XRE-family HTH domain